jgi:hypothetical protein
MKKPIMLIVAISISTTTAYAALKSKVEDAPFPPVEKSGSSLSPGLLLAQAQAPGRPVTADEVRQPAPQTPVRDRVAPNEPPPPPRNTPEPRRGSVGAVRD